MPIQKTKLVISHAHPFGWFSPQTPTPLEIWYPMQNRPNNAMDAHGMNFLPVVDREMKIVGIFTREEIAEKADEPEE